jgi:glyoxylase-like metal-dependent hydrolase (beta-lactamase superfamily II)
MAMDVELISYPGLDSRIVVVRAGHEVDAVFVKTGRFNVLVDTLATPSLCRQALELLGDHMGDRPLVVVNSHMDWDHVWGNRAVGAVPIIAHSTAMDRLDDPSARRKLEDMRSLETRFDDVDIIRPTLTFSGDRLVLHGGDMTLELLHTPGHTPDHLAVWIPELHTCLAVDAVEQPIPEVWSRSPHDLRHLCCSLQKIRALNARHIILAHGQTDDPAVVDRNLAYFETMRDLVARLPEPALASACLDEQDGLRLQDLVSLPAALTERRSPFMLAATNRISRRP